MNDISFIHNQRICLGVPFFRLQVFERAGIQFFEVFCKAQGLETSYFLFG